MLCGLSVYSVLISIFKPIPQSLTGFLVDFIPVPVISGFTSAAAITIAFGQVKVTDFPVLTSPTYVHELYYTMFGSSYSAVFIGNPSHSTTFC